jgi:hypothetical protein
MRFYFFIFATAWFLVSAASPGFGAGFFDRLGIKGLTNASGSSAISGLSEDQVVQGLKEALSKGTKSAVNSLGREDGFLKNASVRIPMPESLRTVEKTLRALKQGQLADSLVETMNRAAEQAVPKAASVFADSVSNMSIEDAKGILAGGTNAATLYFRRTSETNLYTEFLPVVKSATEKTGVTSSYKAMTDKASGTSSLMGGLVRTRAPDLDGYVTQKALDGLFKMVAEEEMKIRQNPAARTTELLQKVFGSTK